MEVIFDTGSDKLLCKSWETVQREMAKVDAGMSELILPSNKIYSHTRSSTYIEKFATSKGKQVPKHGFIAYGSGQAMTQEGDDDVWVGGHRLHRFPVSEITADSLTILHRKKGAAGVMGLQHMKNRTAGESIFTRLRELGMVNAFGYCRGKKEDTGTFIWGDAATDGHPVEVIGNIHWAVHLSDVKVPGAAPPQPTFGAPHAVHAASPGAPHRGRSALQHEEGQLQGGHGAGGQEDPFGFGDIFGGHKGADDDDEQDPFANIPGHHAAAGKQARHPDFDVGRGASLDEQGDERGLADDARAPSGGVVIIEPDTAAGREPAEEPVAWSDVIDSFVEEFTEGEGPQGDALLEVGGGPQARSQTMDWSKMIDRIAQMMQPKVAKLPLCATERCAAIIDTGSNIIAGPPAGIQAIKQLANVKFDCSNLAQLPQLHITLGDKPLTLSPSSYVMKVKLPSWARPLAHRLGALSRSQSAADGASLAEMKARESMLNPWTLTLEHLQRKFGIDLASGLAADMEDLAGLDKLCLPAFVPIDIKTTIGQLWVVGTPLFENYYTRWSWQHGDPSPKIFLEDLHTAQACQEDSTQAAQTQQAPPAQPYYGAQPPPPPFYGQPPPYYPPPNPYYGPPPQPYYGQQPYAQQPPPQPYYTAQQQQQPQPHAFDSQSGVPARLMRAEGRGVRAAAPAELAETGASLEEAAFDVHELEIDEIRFPHWAMSVTEL